MDELYLEPPVGDQILLPGIPERDPNIPPTRGKSGQRLTAKEKRFAVRWLETHKIGESATWAGYAPKHAFSIGSRLLKKSQVAEFISEREEAQLYEAGINRVDALKKLAQMAYWDPRNLYREDGSTKSPEEWDDATAAVIAGVEVMELWEVSGKKKISIGQTKKVKVVDPLRSLEVLLKVLGVMKDGNGVGAPASVTVNQQQNQVIEVVFVNAPNQEAGEKRNNGGEN